jgi:cytochrome oxidase assembly protein ShyY1
MKRIFGLTLLAILLFGLCIQGARWQYERYEIRHAKNELIRENLDKSPLSEADLTLSNDEIAWRKLSISGAFDPSNEILIRNRYYQERYGFGVVTLFVSNSGKRYWVDRGWVPPGKDAQTPPITKEVTRQNVEITVRVRVENIESQVGGTVFALPGTGGESKLEVWNSERAINTEPVYFDLISANPEKFSPDIPTGIPQLSDGPHLAYAFQWLLFAGFVLFGWFLVIREDRRAHSVKA